MQRIFTIGILFFLPALAAAQLYESNCYFPQFGKPGEIDTVYGGYSGQQLGEDVFNPGPIPGYSDGKIFIEGLPQNVPFLSALDPKPPFDLHNFQIQKKQAFRRYNLSGDFAHLRDSKHWDFYAIDGNNVPRIYWSDDDGNYDSTRVTYFSLPIRKGYYFSMEGFNVGLPVVGRFISDSVSDLIFRVTYGTDTLPSKLSDYIALFTGGNKLYMQGDTAYSDSLEPINLIDTPVGNLIVGQFREKGKDDIIGITQFGDWFYYKNDPPFSLANFWRSMLFDTLFTRWQNPEITERFFGGGGIVQSFFPKSAGDSSQDLYFYFNLSGGDAFNNHLYKGGKDFGSKRLFINTADFIFHTPRWYTTDLFGFGMSFYPDYAGDMTGKGYPVYRLWAALDQSRYEFYYVMGAALNDHADMSFRPEPWGLGDIAMLDANGDGKTDILEGMPYYSTQKDLLPNGDTPEKGLLALIRISPLDAVKPINEFHESDLNIYPNPASRYFTFSPPQAEELSIILYDLLGRAVFKTSRIGTTEGSKIKINLPYLSSGSYILEVSAGQKFYRSQVTILN